MGVLGIVTACVALEAAPFHLHPFRERGGHKIGLLQRSTVTGYRNIDVQVEIGVHRSENQQFCRINVEVVAQFTPCCSVAGNTPRGEFIVVEVGNIPLGVKNNGNVRVVHQRTAKETGRFCRAVNSSRCFSGFTGFQHLLHLFDTFLLIADCFRLTQNFCVEFF